MRLNYLGPALLGHDHPALEDLDAQRLPASCYLVEVSEEAGVDGSVIEGDVLVVDESQPVQHGDLTVIDVEGQLRLFRSHRIGGSYRLLPEGGGKGMFATPHDCCGVVVKHAPASEE